MDWFVAGFALAAIVLHDAAHVREGRAHDVLWICNVAAWFCALAPILRSKLAATIALTWLVPGNVIWLADVWLGGAAILPTSYGVHIGGALAACWAVARFGRSGHALWASFALVAICFVVSLALLPAEANVNAAHSIPRGWDVVTDRRGAFVGLLALFSAGVALLGQAFAALVAAAGRAVRA